MNLFMKQYFNFIFLAMAFNWMLSSIVAAQVHPITNELLADEQIFTYVTIDEHTSVDPQIVEDVGGSAIIRDLFEGLYNQDPDGNLVPGVAISHTTNKDKTLIRP